MDLFEQAIESENLHLVPLPIGYEIASISDFRDRPRYDAKSGKTYTRALQLINRDTMDVPRGVGYTLREALDHAVANCGGDDGLSKSIRDALRPEGNA